VIFVDTGAFIARYVLRDDHHRQAKRAWAEIERSRERCFTSNFVLDETLTLLGRRASYVFAADRARSLLRSAALTILRPDAEDEEQAVEVFAKFADQRVSFTDCVSFVLMRRNRLERAFTFDRHFASAGFEVTPKARK
jgi:predicted nucleic acid-binding protein